MNINIEIKESISNKTKGFTCFNAEPHVANAIKHVKFIKGIVTIDDEPIEFAFSSLGIDGDIFTDNTEHRLIIKTLIPIYVYNYLT